MADDAANNENNENENETALTQEELAEAKRIIESLIKKDKNKMLALSALSSSVSSADSITGRLSAKSLYF